MDGKWGFLSVNDGKPEAIFTPPHQQSAINTAINSLSISLFVSFRVYSRFFVPLRGSLFCELGVTASFFLDDPSRGNPMLDAETKRPIRSRTALGAFFAGPGPGG